MKYTAEDFHLALEDYVQYNRKLLADIGPLEGIAGVFGFGRRPGKDPGHQKFLDEMEAALKQAAEDHPDPETAGAIMDTIFHARQVYADEKISPYLFAAVEGMTLGLIPFLSPGKARALYDEYQRLPYSLRVPVVKQILKALKTSAQKAIAE